MAASVRDPDPVIFLEHKSLAKAKVLTGRLSTRSAPQRSRSGKDATICALALMVPRALAGAEKLKTEHGIDCEVVDVRSLVPSTRKLFSVRSRRRTGFSPSRKIRGYADGRRDRVNRGRTRPL